MAQALEEQRETPNTHALAFEERLALLVDRERLSREIGRYRGLLREARLKMAQACVEDVNYKAGRGLERSQIAALADGAAHGASRTRRRAHPAACRHAHRRVRCESEPLQAGRAHAARITERRLDQSTETESRLNQTHRDCSLNFPTQVSQSY